MCGRLPSVLGHTARMAWAVDRPAVMLLLTCQLLTGAAAAMVLAFTAKAMTHILGAGAVSEHLHAALPALTHYANVGERNVRAMMRRWATYSRYGDEVRANGMTSYLVYWYRALSDRIGERTLTAAPRMLRIVLASSALGGVFLLGTWATLAWLATTGRFALPVAATAVVAVQTTLAALSQFVIHGAAMSLR